MVTKKKTTYQRTKTTKSKSKTKSKSVKRTKSKTTKSKKPKLSQTNKLILAGLLGSGLTGMGLYAYYKRHNNNVGKQNDIEKDILNSRVLTRFYASFGPLLTNAIFISINGLRHKLLNDLDRLKEHNLYPKHWLSELLHTADAHFLENSPINYSNIEYIMSSIKKVFPNEFQKTITGSQAPMYNNLIRVIRGGDEAIADT